MGAQKSGTKWLRQYLIDTGDYDDGGLWEPHVWDGLTVPELAHFRLSRPDADSPRRRLRWRLQQSPEAYFEFFSEVCAASGATMAGDITPSYSTLSAATLLDVDRHATEHGFELVPVFVMRDPVERCWSAFRMQSSSGDDLGDVLDEEVEREFVDFARSPATELRTRYDRTLEALADSVGSDRAVVVVYELLFGGGGLRELTDRLGVPCREAAVSTRLQVSTVLPEPSGEAWAEVARFYRPVYERVAEVMPVVRARWGGYSYL